MSYGKLPDTGYSPVLGSTDFREVPYRLNANFGFLIAQMAKLEQRVKELEAASEQCARERGL